MIEELLDYCRTADKSIIQVLKNAENVPPKAVALFSHVLNAQHIWASRILKRKPIYPFGHLYLLKDFEGFHQQNFDLFREIIEKVSLDEKITYINSSGNQFTSKVRDILFHVVNHATHHRGQIAMLLREVGIEPPITDYIFLKRDQKL